MPGPFRSVAVLLLALAAAACAPTRPPQPLAEIDATRFRPVAMDVASVTVDNRYVSTLAAPFVEHFAPTTPVNAVRQWAEQRLRAVGTRGTARVAVIDGRITERSLPRTTGITGLVSRDQTERYDGRIEILIEVEREGSTGSFGAAVERSRTIAEGATLGDREVLLNELVVQLIDDLNARVEEGLRGPLAGFAGR
jgi:Mrp family chromosome partitioning ATPase